MRALSFDRYGGPNVLAVTDLPDSHSVTRS